MANIKRIIKSFLKAAQRKNNTYNDDKSVFSTRRLQILGYVIEDGTIRPDRERLRPLPELPVPHDSKSLNRCLGLFSYYSHWILAYSERIKPITSCEGFPLSQQAIEAFESIKYTIEEAPITAIDEDILFVGNRCLGCQLSFTLSQQSRQVAFFSRTLQSSEIKQAAVEKEAQAIVESVRHSRHFVTGRHFINKTDQNSVSDMFDKQHKGNIKNDKIMQWKLERSCYNFDKV